MDQNTHHMHIDNALDLDGDDISFDDTRVGISVFHGGDDDESRRRINVVIVDGKIYVEQYADNGGTHVHTTVIDAIGA